jgi:hypothetical protein
MHDYHHTPKGCCRLPWRRRIAVATTHQVQPLTGIVVQPDAIVSVCFGASAFLDRCRVC